MKMGRCARWNRPAWPKVCRLKRLQTSQAAVSEEAWTPELAWRAMKEVQELAGEAKNDDPHVARDHDHYLYGAPLVP